MQKIKYTLIISGLFILALPETFAKVADTQDTAYVAAIGMSQADATCYAKSPLSSW